MMENTIQPIYDNNSGPRLKSEKWEQCERWDSWAFPFIPAVNVPLPAEHLEPFYALLRSADLEVQQMSSLSLVNFLLEGNSE